MLVWMVHWNVFILLTTVGRTCCLFVSTLQELGTISNKQYGNNKSLLLIVVVLHPEMMLV